MPRDIGTRTGVKDTVGRSAPQARKFCSSSGVCRCDTADPVRAGRADQLRAEQVRLERPAGTGRPAGRHDDHVVGVGQARGDGGQQRQGGRRRVAAGNRDGPGAGQLVPLPGQLRQAVRPGAGMRACRRTAATPRRPPAGSPRRSRSPPSRGCSSAAMRCRGPVRQGQEDDVVPGQHLRRGLGDDPVGEAASGAAAAPPAGRPALVAGGERTDLDLGMAEQQAKQLAARVAGGTRHRRPDMTPHKYAAFQKTYANDIGR